MNEMVCKLCGGHSVNQILDLEYAGVVYNHQLFYKCNACGLIYTNRTKEEDKRDYCDAKSVYLGEVAANFLKEYFEENALEGVDLKYAHINTNLFENYNKFMHKRILIISDMLEHTYSIKKIMDEIKEADYEYIYLQVPVYDNKRERDLDLYGMFIEEHCNYFSEYTVFQMMDLLGYCCKKKYIDLGKNYKMPMIFPCLVSLWEKKGTIEGVAEPQRTSIKEYLIQCQNNINDINRVIDKEIKESTRLAVWGTSNYLQKMLGMTHLREKNIVCFFDNNISRIGSKINGIDVLKYEKKYYEKKFFQKVLIASNTVQHEIKDELLNLHHIQEQDILIIESVV